MIETAGTLRARLRETVLDAMVEAAERVLIEKGYEKATMQEIAAATGCAVGTLYIHFKNKEELFKAVVSRQIAGLRRRMHEATAEVREPLEKLRVQTRVHLEWMNDNVDFANMFCSAMPMRYHAFEEQLSKVVPEEHADFHREQLEMIAAAQAKGQLRKDFSAEVLAEMFEGLMLTMMDQFSARPGKFKVDEQMRMLWGMALGGMSGRDKGSHRGK